MQPDASDETRWTLSREAMVRNQIVARRIQDPRVLASLLRVPRHRFVSAPWLAEAYADHPLPIGPAQTISQPYIVAFMAEVLELQGSEKILEVGSGCGYFAAVLSCLAGEIFGIELQPKLVTKAQETCKELGLQRIEFRHGDGALGWPEQAPFDVIVLSCASRHIPEPLKEQLGSKGRLLLPLEGHQGFQELVLLKKNHDGWSQASLLPVRFVPMESKL